MCASTQPFYYLGKLYDPKTHTRLEQPLLYDPADLTTHGVVTGMTGSGKTGLCIVLLEEAARQGTPAIIVDLKGDLTNLLLHFPEMKPADFEPWIDPEQARREGISVQEMAEKTAINWKNGLAEWGLGPQDLLALQNAANFRVYTPGSSAGQPVNILSSFAAPDSPWTENQEIFREKISTTVSALLGLIGITDVDPLRSREHILIANIFEHAWSRAQSLTLPDLIMQVQSPPFEHLGAFPVDRLFPEKDRFELAMLLNNFLASPSFQTWLAGESLDVTALLSTDQGKPTHSVFYLAHLNDNERMFFLTILLASIEAWMRTRRGTSSLRALLYIDELYGYLPPVANPPSRPVLLRMLKQARAFGLGLLLATQNPVDLDYKALSNAGTWFIGRLQTEQDKNRLLDGLQGAVGNFDRSTFDQQISGLGKRVFLLHNVHNPAPLLFQTRWAMNFLAGPLTRAQIPALLQLPGGQQDHAAPQYSTAPVQQVSSQPLPASAVVPVEPVGTSSLPRPVIPSGIQEIFLPVRVDASSALSTVSEPNAEVVGLTYRPALFAQSQVYYRSQRLNFSGSRRFAALLQHVDHIPVAWENYRVRAIEPGEFSKDPLPQAGFAQLPGWLSEARRVTLLKKDFEEWVYRAGTLDLKVNETLGISDDANSNGADFYQKCQQAAQKRAEAGIDKIETAYGKKIAALQRKIERQKLEVDSQSDEVNQRRIEELSTHGEFLLGMFTGRKRRLSSSLSKRRMSSQAKADLEEENQELKALERQLKDLEEEKQQAVEAEKDRWAKTVQAVASVPLSPNKKDIFVEVFSLVWLPHYLVKGQQGQQEVPAYQSERA